MASLPQVWLFFTLTSATPLPFRAATPPLKPDELIKLFLAPLGLLLPALFDDGRGIARLRFVRTAWIAVGFAISWAVVHVNVSDARPHIGHLAGVGGVLHYRFPEVVGMTVWCSVPALVFFYCLDGLAIGVWSLIRGFTDDPADAVNCESR